MSIVSRPNATCIVIAIARSIFANVRKVNNVWQKKAAKMAVEDYFIDQKIKSVRAHLQKQKKMGK